VVSPAANAMVWVLLVKSVALALSSELMEVATVTDCVA